ncbi:unnamed protein product [Protopolystoma xenopodis]|uniref:Uncharacterized protein n=1 Tax=Protopolystoma xenopodis TaxID=117903 RepID=A0A3S5BKT6_9PLAT|nr:unnamed protein product [Protopolystoma xenopodis]
MGRRELKGGEESAKMDGIIEEKSGKSRETMGKVNIYALARSAPRHLAREDAQAEAILRDNPSSWLHSRLERPTKWCCNTRDGVVNAGEMGPLTQSERTKRWTV